MRTVTARFVLSALVLPALVLPALVLSALIVAGGFSTAAADDWIDALVELRPSPLVSGASIQRRIKAARRLGRYGDARTAVQLLLSALRIDPPAVLRAEILRSLARRGHPDSLPALRDLMQKRIDPVEPVFIALAAVGNRQAVDALIDALNDDNDAYAESAGEALIRVGGDAVHPLLERLESKGARGARMARVLGAIGDKRAVPALIKQIESDGDEERMEALQALEAIGDKRAGPAVAARLNDPSAEVVAAALQALGAVGGSEHGPLLLDQVKNGHPRHRLLALRSLALIDAELALPELGQALDSDDERSRRLAVECVLDNPRSSFIPLLLRLFERGVEERAAASALARVPGGAGVVELIKATAQDGEKAQKAALAVAIGLRQWRFHLDENTRQQALRLLRGVAGAERQMIARAIAKDEGVSASFLTALRSADASLRAAGAYSIEILGFTQHPDALVTALGKEIDPEAFRRQAMSALHLGIDASLHLLWRRFSDPRTAPEAMLLSAHSSRSALPRYRKRLGKSLRRALRPDRGAAARTRAAAALGLALMRDQTARGALIAALQDRSAPVRMAAVRALGLAPDGQVVAALQQHERVERDKRVRSETLKALERIGSFRPRTPFISGIESLQLRIVTAPGFEPSRPLVDVLLADGRWLRIRTLRDGHLVLVDQGPGFAEVRIRDPAEGRE